MSWRRYRVSNSACSHGVAQPDLRSDVSGLGESEEARLGVGFGYTPNKMQMGLVGGAGAFAMLKAFFEAL